MWSAVLVSGRAFTEIAASWLRHPKGVPAGFASIFEDPCDERAPVDADALDPRVPDAPMTAQAGAAALSA
jgi:hypothetical protein